MQASATPNSVRPQFNDIENLVNAGKAVETVIMQDEIYPDLGDVLTGGTSDSYIKPLSSPAEEFSELHRVPIPQSIQTQMGGLQFRCFMGLFPEIGRAWLTIDHRLFIWNYTNPQIFEYKDQDQIIVSVAIIKPKPGIFGDKIHHILVLSTPLQIILLGLHVSLDDLKLFVLDMTVPADDIQMRVIKGTDDGRIFMIGNDANVYEFIYNAPGSLFTSKCYIVCRTTPSYMKYVPQFMSNVGRASNKALAVDNERKVLYLMDETSVEAIHLGNNSNEYRSIAKNINIVESALQICRQYSRSYNVDAFRLESIHVISEAESKRIHLMVMTSAGFRLYFSLYKDGFRNTITPPSYVPNALELGHVRLPPPADVLTAPLRLRKTYYDCGICLSVNHIDEARDMITVTSVAPSITPPSQPSSYPLISAVPNRPVYVETFDTVIPRSKAWEITETKPEMRGKHPMKEIAQQLSQPARQFIAMTTEDIVFYSKLRPVDVLLKTLDKSGRLPMDEQKDYQAFFERYGKTESCAMCLSVICNTEVQSTVAKATTVFFEYGGAPTTINSMQAVGNHLGQIMGSTGVTFSGRHDGFLLYFSRMIAPIWNLKVFVNCDPTNPQSRVRFAQAQTILYDSRANLQRLKAFMDKNSKFHDSANISDPKFQATDRTQLELDLAEQKSVHELYLLLAQCIDVVFFVEFLLDSYLETIITKDTPADNLQALFDLDIKTMLTTSEGRGLASDLVVAIIGKYGAPGSHASFNVVSHELQRRCSSYFGANDILFFQGMEHLGRSICAETEYDRMFSIKESLKHFNKAASSIPEDKLKAICQVYVRFAFHIGVVQLSLSRAQMLDPDNLALVAFESPQKSNELQSNLYKARLSAYDFALEALSDAHRLKYQPLPAGRSPIGDPNVYSRMVTDAALESKDAIFHFRLYSWFIENNLRDELLIIDTPFLVPYFKEYVKDDVSSWEFLWKYYRSHGQYFKAAVYLRLLAFSESPSISLSRRVEFLALAGINIQVTYEDNTVSPGDVALFRQELEKNIKNSQLQKRVQDILRSTDDVEAQVAADNLDKMLLSENDLKDCISNFHVLSIHLSQNI
ncbi:hypothetical protein INT47_012381 [Mucor saturninus]|uniref:Nuclear pore complex protein Nup155 n=1 Tax=Mucor saturninus TaxID=64648 RepID=A0A8H7QQB9_9FUNG|nr:hypothetical protein INT47_012381 [Mucor saturninus]